MKDIFKLDVIFPIIIIGPEKTLEVCKNKRALTITTKLGLNKRIQLNNTLVDSRGNFFKTMKVEKIRQLSPKWKFWKTNPIIETKLYAIPETPRVLDKFKKEIIELIKQNSEFWENNIDLETLVEKIDDSQAFNEVVYHLDANH